MEGHQHDEPTMVLVHRGSLHVSEGGTEIRESAGTLRLSQGGTGRTVRTNPGADCLSSRVSPRMQSPGTRSGGWSPALRASDTRSRCRRRAGPCGVLTRIRAPRRGVLPRSPDQVGPRANKVHWRLRRGLTVPSRCSSTQGEQREHVEMSLARSAFIPCTSLVSCGDSLVLRCDLLRRERIVRAARLLRSSEMSVSWVAHQSGFADHGHFTREFVRRHGQAPSVGRRLSTVDVVSIQASDFPATHLGRLTTEHSDSTRDTGETACGGGQSSRE